MTTADIIGFLAGFLTTACFVPQALKALRADDTRSISLLMYSMFAVGVSLWLIYGLIINSVPVIICNSVTLPLACVILYKKLHNIKKKVD